MQFSLIYIFVILNILILIKLSKDKCVHLFLKIAIWISYLGWHIIPFIIYFITDANIGDPLEYIYITCNVYDQLFQFALLSFSYFLIKKNKNLPRIFHVYDWQDNYHNQLIFWKLAVLILFITSISIFTRTTGYADRNDLATVDDNLAAGILYFFSGISVAIVLIPIIFRESLFTRKQVKVSVLLIILFTVSNVYQSARIYLFFLVILLIYYAISENNKKILFLSGIMSIIAFSLLPALSSLRQDSAQVNFSSLYVSGHKEILNEIRMKTNSVWTSSSLILHDGIGGGGSQIYTSTIYALVPRVLFPSKPQPGSQNGQISGLPSRLVAKYSMLYSAGIDVGDSNNAGVSASIESLWVGGIWSVLLQILLGSYLLFFVNCSFMSKKFYFSAISLMMINLPICIVDISLVNILIMAQRYFFIYIFVGLFLRNNYKK